MTMSRDFKGIWIPRHIWLNEKLSLQSKALWAEIDSLYDEEAGGCYASDEYFQAFLQIKRSRLHELFKELSDEGLLLKVSFNGRKTIRKAINSPDLCGQQVSGKPDSSRPESDEVSGKPDSSDPENRIPSYNKRKAKRKDIHISSSKIKFRENVSLEQSEYDKLLALHGNEKLEMMLDDLNSWKGRTGKEYKSDYFAMDKGSWVLKSVEEKIKNHKKPEENTKSNEQFARETLKKYQENPECKVYFEKDQVTFKPSIRSPFRSETIFYDAQGFKEQFVSELHKKDFKIKKEKE